MDDNISIEEVERVVRVLNREVVSEIAEEHGPCFKAVLDGEDITVLFLGMVVWDSATDDRLRTTKLTAGAKEEIESLEEHIRKEANLIIDDLVTLKF